MNRTKKCLAILIVMALTLPAVFRLQVAYAGAATRDVAVTIKNMPHGKYRAWIFKVGDAQPTQTKPDFHPVGGMRILFKSVPTKAEYFFRVTNLDSDDTRQWASFYLPDSPRWTQTEPSRSW